MGVKTISKAEMKRAEEFIEKKEVVTDRVETVDGGIYFLSLFLAAYEQHLKEKTDILKR